MNPFRNYESELQLIPSGETLKIVSMGTWSEEFVGFKRDVGFDWIAVQVTRGSRDLLGCPFREKWGLNGRQIERDNWSLCNDCKYFQSYE